MLYKSFFIEFRIKMRVMLKYMGENHLAKLEKG